MSGTDYFDDGYAINAHMDDKIPVDLTTAATEHAAIADCLQQAGIIVEKVAPPVECQDGVYTANWALIVGNKAVMANLPNIRQAEQPYAEAELQRRGYQTIKLPNEIHFSGQGDALPCGNYLFIGTTYRTSPLAHHLLAKHTGGLDVISLQTVPQIDAAGNLVINRVTNWPDSFFYDLDLALAVISPTCIAWCPDAFVPESQAKIRALPLDKIEVSLDEAMHGFACNLVSTGESVVMSDHAPEFKAKLQARGLTVYSPHVTELLKGGGFIRCTTLTLN